MIIISWAAPPRAKVKAVPTNGAEHGVASIVANTPVEKWWDIFGQIAWLCLLGVGLDKLSISLSGALNLNQPKRLAEKASMSMHDIVMKTGCWNCIPQVTKKPRFLSKIAISDTIPGKSVLKQKKHLRFKKLSTIINAQKVATQRIFKLKKIPFRSFEILKKDENSLGVLFCFFVLETILLGRALKVNPFDQPSVELIKIETKKLLI